MIDEPDLLREITEPPPKPPFLCRLGVHDWIYTLRHDRPGDTDYTVFGKWCGQCGREVGYVDEGEGGDDDE